MNALMRLNQIRPGLQYKLLSQSGPVHAPVFTMSVDVDGTTYEASGPSKKTAKLHVAVKVQYLFYFAMLSYFMFQIICLFSYNKLSFFKHFNSNIIIYRLLLLLDNKVLLL